MYLLLTVYFEHGALNEMNRFKLWYLETVGNNKHDIGMFFFTVIVIYVSYKCIHHCYTLNSLIVSGT